MATHDVLCLAEDLQKSDDPFATFALFAKAQGVHGYFYGFASLKIDLENSGFTKGVYLHHTYSPEWETEVFADDGLNDDPSISSLESGANCVIWHQQDSRESRTTLTKKQVRRIEIENDLGMIHGASLQLSGQAQSFSGIGLWFSGVSSDTEFSREWASLGEKLVAASNLLDVSVRTERPNILIRLTVRERDCLCWLARGLRPAEICWRLKISEKTFEKHISSAKQKLRSRTRDQALAKAVLLNLLAL